MATSAHKRHVNKSRVYALYGRGQTIMGWGNWIVGVLGLGTCGAWILSKLLHQDSKSLLAADSFLWQTFVVLYFTSWITGVPNDKKLQEKVYVAAPETLRVGMMSLSIAAFIYMAFAAMFVDVAFALFAKDAKPYFTIGLLQKVPASQCVLAFVLFLDVFWVANFFIWRYYVRNYIQPLDKRSRSAYKDERDYVGLLKLKIIRDYIDGRWQWYRYGVGVLLLAGCSILFWLEQHGDDVTLVVAAALGGFLLVVEGSIWLMRLRTDHALASLDDIARTYRLVPHRERPPPGEGSRRLATASLPPSPEGET